MAGELELQGAVKRTKKGDADWYYGGGEEAWPSKADAYAGIDAAIRPGKSFGVWENGVIVEYKWKNESQYGNGQEVVNAVAAESEPVQNSTNAIASSWAYTIQQTINAWSAIIGSDTPDGDTVVNTLKEMLSVFQDWNEGVDLATQLNSKLSASAKASLTELQAGVEDSKFTTAKGIADWLAWRITQALEFSGAVGFTQRPTVNGDGLAKLSEAATLTEEQKATIPIGESNIFTVTKNLDGSVDFGANISQMNIFGPPGLSVLLGDDQNWGNIPGLTGDYIKLTGDNLTGALGRGGQDFEINGQFYLCKSHDYGTDTTNGYAIWARNRSRDCLTPGIPADDAIITVLENPAGWNEDGRKAITVKSKVGSWYINGTGPFHFCYNETLNPDGTGIWHWARNVISTNYKAMEFTAATHPVLTGHLAAHDFSTTPWYTPVAGDETTYQFQEWNDEANGKIYKKYMNGKFTKIKG